MKRVGIAVYMVQAQDRVVRTEDFPKFTDALKRELLERTNPEFTKGLQSFLPLYRGMRFRLASKDCVRFGVMKGCTCTLKEIVFADAEDLSQAPLAGEVVRLKYVPVSLILQAPEAAWILPRS